MLLVAFIIPLLSHFAITLPASFRDIIPFLYTKYQHRNDDSIIIHQNNSCENGTVIFIHGRNGHSSIFTNMIQKLKEMKIEKSFIAVNLGPTGNTSVTNDTDTLHNLLEEIGRDKITLVGLSKGGLTVLNYVAKYGTKNISAVITISSPLGGTMVPDYFMSANHIARIELGYKSKFTQELKKNLPTNIPFYHVVPTWDHIIVPVSSASIDGPNHESKIYTGFNGHLSIQDAPEVIQYIADWIRKN